MPTVWVLTLIEHGTLTVTAHSDAATAARAFVAAGTRLIDGEYDQFVTSDGDLVTQEDLPTAHGIESIHGTSCLWLTETPVE